MLPQRAMPTPTYMTIVPTRTSPLARRIYGTPGERSPKPPHTSAFDRAQNELLRQGHAEYQELAMLRSGQRRAHGKLTQRPATAAAALGTTRPVPPALRSCGSPRPTSGRALVTPPRTAEGSSHVDIFSHSKPPSSRPVTHEGRRRPHVRDDSHQEASEVGAAERAMWRRELATVQQALAESEARLQRLQAAQAMQAAPAHAAHSAATHSVPRAVNVHRAGPARLSPGMVRHRATQVIAKGRLEHEAMRGEVEADLQRMWRGLKVRPAPPRLSCPRLLLRKLQSDFTVILASRPRTRWRAGRLIRLSCQPCPKPDPNPNPGRHGQPCGCREPLSATASELGENEDALGELG